MNCILIFFASCSFVVFMGATIVEFDGVGIGSTPAALFPQAGL